MHHAGFISSALRFEHATTFLRWQRTNYYSKINRCHIQYLLFYPSKRLDSFIFLNKYKHCALEVIFKRETLMLRCVERCLPVSLHAGWFVFPAVARQHFYRKVAINVKNDRIYWYRFNFVLWRFWKCAFNSITVQMSQSRILVRFLTVSGYGPSTLRCRLERRSFHWLSSNHQCKRPQRHLDRGKTTLSDSDGHYSAEKWLEN